MENVDAEISIEIGVLLFSMEFHWKCPNPPCKYFSWKPMEKFPWNSMEIDVLKFHGEFPWNSMEVFHTELRCLGIGWPLAKRLSLPWGKTVQ